MEYTKSYFKDVVSEYGEVFFVLDSGVEYEVHGSDQYEFRQGTKSKATGPHETVVHVEGMREGEYLKVDFPLDVVEHHYTHREV